MMQRQRRPWPDRFPLLEIVLLFPLLLAGMAGCRSTFSGGDYCNVAPPVTDPNLLLGNGQQIYLSAPSASSFYAINRRNGSLLWKYHVSAQRELMVNGIVYLETESPADIYALRGSDGKLLWQRSVNAEMLQTLLAVADRQIYISTGASNSAMRRLEAINASDGALLWSSSERASEIDVSHSSQTGSPLTVVNGMVYLVSRDAQITVLRERDGTLVWRYTPSPLAGYSGPLRLEATAIGESIIFLSIENDQTYASHPRPFTPARGVLIMKPEKHDHSRHHAEDQEEKNPCRINTTGIVRSLKRFARTEARLADTLLTRIYSCSQQRERKAGSHASSHWPLSRTGSV